MKNHNTHNLSVISSETCSYKNETNSIQSTYKEYLEENKVKNEWSKLLKKTSSQKDSNRIINEDEIDITKNYYEKQSSQPNEKDEKNNNIESRVPDYLKGKYHYLDNGIILRDVNKTKNSNKNKIKLTSFFIQKEKDNNNNEDNKIKNVLSKKIKMLEEKSSFQIKCIKKPDLSFITKIIKSSKLKPVKIKKYKKFNSSNSSSLKSNSYRFNNISRPFSDRVIPIPKMVLTKKEENKNLLNKIAKAKINLNDNNNNSYNKMGSLSTISPQKLSINSYKSLSDAKSNNNYLKKKNKFKNRPTSSITQEIVEQNNKNLKNDNFEITSYVKSSYNKFKTRPVSSMMNSKNNQKNKIKINVEEKMIYDNENFIKEFNELKECFKSYKSNNKITQILNFSKPNCYSREYQKNAKRQNKIIRKSNSERIKNDDFYDFHPKDIIPLHNFEFKSYCENERQNKRNHLYKSFEYRKHYGNENSCPICVTIREQNHLREEKCSNKYHYFPFKDKFESINSQQNSININNYNYINNYTSEQIFKNCYNTISLNNSKKHNLLTTFNPFYLNNIYNSPKRTKKDMIRCKIKHKNSLSKIIKYNIIHKYFE